MKYKKVHTWKQLLVDPRIREDEIWWEDGQGEPTKDVWIPLADGFNIDGCSCIHEWSKKAAINALNRVVEGNPY